jgi:superfamily II DNA or RNA helicase
MTASEWELAGPHDGGSHMYAILDPYQREGYQALMKIARKYRGAFLCDGVGLGKTFVGMMVIERLVVHERKRVALIVPKAGRQPVWEAALKKYLPRVRHRDFSNLVIFNHTDLQREGEYQDRLDHIAEMADAIIIDEAHHFRNPGIKGTGSRRPSRYRRMFEITGGKELYLLTATPVNNRLIDLQHMIELFSRNQTDYFKDAPLGIHSLAGHFRKMEKDLEQAILGRQATDNPEEGVDTNEAEAREILFADNLVQALVVQRSRAYVKASQRQHGGTEAIFPVREPPQVVEYSVKKTFGRLLELMEKAFEKQNPLFSLAIYYPLHYYKGPDTEIDPLEHGRQKQVVALIRTQFLKRFESSAQAFDSSCQTILLRLLAFLQRHSETAGEKKRLERWKAQHEKVLAYVLEQQKRWSRDEDEADEDLVTDEMLEDVEYLSRDEYEVEEIIQESYLDLDQLAVFLAELMKFEPKNDDKLKALIKLLKSDSVLKKHKVLIFSEYMTTARYLKAELEKASIDGIDEVDSAAGRDRGDVIRRFAPYYNDSSSPHLAKLELPETRILISTDVLSEGLNLQDATRLINYDLHWNPVRLMQRIGRVDRRMNPEVEQHILADHPDQKAIRGKVAYWNFLPPAELDGLLRLYQRVTGKTLRISKTFGIEGKKLLRPDDDFEALKDFNHAYEGTTTFLEQMHLEFQKLLKDHPDLASRLAELPGRVFSGKAHPKQGSRAVFLCFALPAPRVASKEETVERDADLWSEEAGTTVWYLYDLASERIAEQPEEIIELIRSGPETPIKHEIEARTLSEIRAKIEKHIKNGYLKKVQAPLGVRPILKAWMELP